MREGSYKYLVAREGTLHSTKHVQKKRQAGKDESNESFQSISQKRLFEDWWKNKTNKGK